MVKHNPEAQRSAQELHDAIITHSSEMAKAMSILLSWMITPTL